VTTTKLTEVFRCIHKLHTALVLLVLQEIAIEHNHGSLCRGGNASAVSPHAGPGSITGCPAEYYGMADIRRDILRADPYHLGELRRRSAVKTRWLSC
jgi:hypothetical protein